MPKSNEFEGGMFLCPECGSSILLRNVILVNVRIYQEIRDSELRIQALMKRRQKTVSAIKKGTPHAR